MIEGSSQSQIAVHQLDYPSSYELGLVEDAREMLIDLYQFDSGLPREDKSWNNLQGDRKIGAKVQRGSYLGGVVAAIEFVHPLLRMQNSRLAYETQCFRNLAILNSVKVSWHNRDYQKIDLFIKKSEKLVNQMLAELGVLVIDTADNSEIVAAA